MTKAEVRTLFAAIIPDGMEVWKLSPEAKREKRAALDVILKLAERK